MAHGIAQPHGSPAPGGVAPAIRRFVDKQRERWNGLHDLPARTALRIANTPRVRRLLAARYHDALALHAPALPRLSVQDRVIVAALERDGVYITSLERLGLAGASRVTTTAAMLAGGFAAEARRLVAGGQDFVIVPPDQVAAQPALYSWGLSDRLLAIAEAYLGLPPAYDGVTINYTVADGREVSTRKWHRDWEDRRMLKVAVYLNDVDGEGGPFQMIKRATPGQNDAEGYRYDLASGADLDRALGEDHRADIVSCEGPEGTVIFTDTARFFHRGKPAIARDRMAVFYSYFARRPRHPFFCERSGLTRAHVAMLARRLNPQQRKAALWRAELPVWLRMIPPARL